MINSRNIVSLRDDVANAVRNLMIQLKNNGIRFIITSTVRDVEYQKYLYAQGRTRPGQIVTYLQYPTFHRYGLAFDFCPVDGSGQCMWNNLEQFKEVGEIAKKLGFTWGGDWKIKDYCHCQWDNHGKIKNDDLAPNKKPKLPERMIIQVNKVKNMQEIIKFVQEKTGLSSETIAFLKCYKYSDELFLKLENAVKNPNEL